MRKLIYSCVFAATLIAPIAGDAAKLKETVLETNKDNKRYFSELIARVRGEVCEPIKIVLHGELPPPGSGGELRLPSGARRRLREISRANM